LSIKANTFAQLSICKRGKTKTKKEVNMNDDRKQVEDLAQRFREHEGDSQLVDVPDTVDDSPSWPRLCVMAFLAVLLILGAVGFVKTDTPTHKEDVG